MVKSDKIFQCWFEKRFMYEESLRMTFVIRYPKKIAPKTKIKDIISNIDIAPTILEMANVAVPDEVREQSFFENLKGESYKDLRQSMYYHYYENPFWYHVQPH